MRQTFWRLGPLGFLMQKIWSPSLMLKEKVDSSFVEMRVKIHFWGSLSTDCGDPTSLRGVD